MSRVSLCGGRIARRDVERAVRAASRLRPGRLRWASVSFLTPREIAGLNRRFLGHRGPTDVLSFPLTARRGEIVGDICICPQVARASARRFGATVRAELLRLVVHGTLHLLGYDHPEGADRTRSTFYRRQERVLGRLL